MSLKDFFKDFDWKNPSFESYKQAFLKPRPINLLPLRRKDKIENGYVLASFSTRTFAMTLDMLIILILFAPMLQWVSNNMFPELSTDAAQQKIMGMFHAVGKAELTPQRFIEELNAMGVFQRVVFDHVLQMLIAGAYAVLAWQRWQATPAMWLLRLKVLDAQTYEKPTLKNFIIRYAMMVPSILALTLGFLWIVFDKRNQGWHDKVAGTIVIQKPFSSWWKKEVKPEDSVVETTQP